MPVRRCNYASFEEAMGFEPAMKHVSELREIQPEELSALRKSVGEEVLSTPVEIEHQYSEGQKSAPSVVHQAEDTPCGFEREWASDVLDDAQEEMRDQLDSEVQTISNVIEEGTVVEYCPECFPDLASWTS